MDEAIRLNPQDAEAYSNRGTAYFELGQPERAIQDLDEAIRLNPTLVLAYVSRAETYTVLGRDTEAEQDIDRAVGLGFDRFLLDTEIERLKKLRSQPETPIYTNSEFGFSVEYPNGWYAEEDLMMQGMVVAFMGPSVLGGSCVVNVSIVKEQLPEFQKPTLEEYCSAVEFYLDMYLADYKKIEETHATVGGLPAIERTYSFTIKFDEEELEFKDCQAYFIKDEVAYTIAYDTPVEFYNEYADCYDLVIRSFKFEYDLHYIIAPD